MGEVTVVKSLQGGYVGFVSKRVRTFCPIHVMVSPVAGEPLRFGDSETKTRVHWNVLHFCHVYMLPSMAYFSVFLVVHRRVTSYSNV